MHEVSSTLAASTASITNELAPAAAVEAPDGAVASMRSRCTPFVAARTEIAGDAGEVTRVRPCTPVNVAQSTPPKTSTPSMRVSASVNSPSHAYTRLPELAATTSALPRLLTGCARLPSAASSPVGEAKTPKSSRSTHVSSAGLLRRSHGRASLAAPSSPAPTSPSSEGRPESPSIDASPFAPEPHARSHAPDAPQPPHHAMQEASAAATERKVEVLRCSIPRMCAPPAAGASFLRAAACELSCPRSTRGRFSPPQRSAHGSLSNACTSASTCLTCPTSKPTSTSRTMPCLSTMSVEGSAGAPKLVNAVSVGSLATV